MGRQELIEKLIDVLSDEFEVAREKFSEEALIKADLGLDSLDMVDVVVFIEQEFGAHLKSEDFVQCKTFGQMVDLILERSK